MPKTDKLAPRLSVKPGYCGERNANLLTLEDGAEIWWKAIGHDISTSRINDDYAVAAALPLAMVSGKDLYVDGVVDRRFLSTLEEYSHAWALWRPKQFYPVRIDAREITDFYPAKHAAGSLIALSGGIDSVYALKLSCVSDAYRYNEKIAATVTMHGFDIPWRDEPAFVPTSTCTGEISRHFDLPNLIVRTNWTDHVADYLTFHPLGIACIFHQHNARFAQSFIAADFDFAEDARIHPKGSNAVSNRMLSSSAMPVGVLGEREVRFRKILDILEDEVLDRNLTPCTNKERNRGERCGRCRKCIFTDIARFYRNRTRMTAAQGRQLFFRIARFYDIRGSFTYVFATETARIIRDDCPLLWVGLKIRLAKYHLRRARRSLLTGARIKALWRLLGMRR